MRNVHAVHRQAADALRKSQAMIRIVNSTCPQA
jgi:hypothetical protein